MKTLSVKRGFTLIELLVVVAIVAMLASVILVSLSSARTKAKNARVMSDMSQIRYHLENIITNAGSYFNTNGLTATVDAYASTDLSALTTDIATYGGTNFAIRHPADAPAATPPTSVRSYAIVATLPDGTNYCIDSGGRVSVPAAGAAVLFATLSSVVTIACP